ncbi:retrovirus-related pol polyprotein from transposon TNT 1-94, partial [Tanacetum coccineum]
MKKMYCLVVKDDYSRFTWVFFLATKDETSGILKSFITRIENLVDHKVKMIRCDNRTEFKNREKNQFCEMKGILRQFSVARTPQQNRVAERRNMTLIKATKTMLAGSKLPTTFWVKAVNTACYVQNKVLVGKPHNKTPYELFHGRTPTLSFMRPFRCPVTILNTIDHLGKFDGKTDEHFFVGYSLNSKAFRVFNSRTRIVEENLHIRFSESTPNVVGIQTNSFAGTKASDNAGQARIETEPVKNYILLPLWTVDPPYSQDPKSYHDDGSKTSSDDGKKVDKDPRKDLTIKRRKIMLIALTMLMLLAQMRDDEDDGVEADMNNLDTTIQVSPIPTTRIHKDHPLYQVIRDLQLATKTRKMSKNLKEHGFEEPKKAIHALKDPSWIEAMQEELLQFKLQEVWTLVDLPNGKRAIGTKWVFKNKKDERGIVIINKARLVAQGYTQEEGINYDEVFAPVARIEAIRLFLAYASFKDFMVHQMDVKSAFIYWKIEEEVYVCQPPGFEDPNFPNRVYKVEKLLYGLHQAPRAWYETLSTYMLDNEFQIGKIDKTLFIKRHKGVFCWSKFMRMISSLVQQRRSYDLHLRKIRVYRSQDCKHTNGNQKPLLKDEDGEEVDVHMYRSMIGSLMYLTSSRPDIMFAVCTCGRYQVNPKYTKDSLFDLVAYTDSDYARASLDKKSTTGEAEYVVASSCCRQVLWIQNQLLDY